MRRRAVIDKVLPVNLSLVHDYMLRQDRRWKDHMPSTTSFSDIARKLELEVGFRV